MAPPALTSSLRSVIRRVARAGCIPAVALLASAAASPGTLVAQQSATLSGRVTVDGTPTEDVAVYLERTTRGTLSGADGRYRLTGIAPGRYTIIAQRVGTAPRREAVTIAEGTHAVLDIALTPAAALITPMSVSATREMRRRDEGSATIDVLDGAEVRRSRASHPSGLMNRIPGVHVSELSGEGHSMSMRQPITTKPMYLYLEDGIPTRATGFFNHNALYEVNIPQSGGVEVLKGPGTALYGSDAIGGIVNVLTRPAPITPSVEASVEGGQHGYGRVLATGGLTRGSAGLRADVNATTSRNWKDEAPFRRRSATLRWDQVMPGWTARTVLTGSTISQQDVPPLTSTQYAERPSFNLAPIAYRKVQALRFSAALERDAGSSLWSVTPYARINDMKLLPSWQLSYDPQTYETSNRSAGVQAKYRRDFEPLQARLIVGADAELSPGAFEARRALITRSATGAYTSYAHGETQYDYDVTYRVASPYLHAELSPARALRIDAGVRADFSGYDYTNRLTPLDTGAHRRPASTSRSYSHLSPKLGVTVIVDPRTSLFASYRHGFRAPSQGQLFTQSSAENTVDLAPVKVDAFEAGIRGQVGQRLMYQLSAYDMTIRDDIITFQTSANTREARNAGRSRHRGIEAGAGAALTSALRLDASWSVSKQYYVEWTPQEQSATRPRVSYSGNLIENAPRDLGSVFLAYAPPALRGGRVAFEWSHTGGYMTHADNRHRYGGYELLHLHASVNLNARTELFGRVTNLADRDYAELVNWDNFLKDQITPGAPRSVYLGFKTGL